MIISVNGGVPRPGVGTAEEAELNALLDAVAASLEDAPGFISSHDCVTEEGEEINILRFETEADLIRWRDTGVHGAVLSQIDRFYESFWIQTAEVHREYIWRGGEKTHGDLAWLFRGDPPPS